jgi:hypothetical protein
MAQQQPEPLQVAVVAAHKQEIPALAQMVNAL